MKQKRALILWGAVLLAVLAAAWIVPWLLALDPRQIDPGRQFAPPGSGTLLGTDQFGRDVLARTLWGARNSLLAALFATTVAALIGGLIGGLAGALGRAPDWLLMRGVDVMLAFPGLLLALVLVAILESGMWQAALAVGIALAPAFSRLVRAAVLSVISRPFVEAARALGAGPWWILSRHLLPNISGQLIAFATVIYAWSLLNMAALDFLGVSGSPSVATWGRLLAEGRTYLRVAPWIALVPGTMLTVSVIAVMGFSDAWRSRLGVDEQ